MATVDVLPPLGEDLAPASSNQTTSPIDRPIIDIAAQPLGASVLDGDLPGLRGRPEYSAFSRMSLRQLQQISGGRFSASELRRVNTDLRVAFEAPELRPRVYSDG